MKNISLDVCKTISEIIVSKGVTDQKGRIKVTIDNTSILNL